MALQIGLKTQGVWVWAALLAWAGRAAIALTMLAVVVGHLNPPIAIVEPRFAGPARPVIVKGGECWKPLPGGIWVDPESGTTSTLPLPTGGLLVNAAIAPWQDRLGRTQVVGAWNAHAGGALPTGCYLTRFSLPDGSLLDWVELDSLLIAPPCFVPSEPDRVVLALQDGELYQHAFQPGERPRRLIWLVDRPLGAGSRMHAPIWPADSQLSGFILVAVEPRCVGPGGPDFQELWWLRASNDGTKIEAAGPLLTSGWPGRCPAVALDRYGTPTLAYLSKGGRTPYFQLCVAPIEFDDISGVPTVRADRIRILADGCHHTPPVFSADRAVIFAVSAEPTRFAILRIPLGLE